MKLGVNIDHIATLRQARKEIEPDLLFAAQEVLRAGAHGITIHLREDRRHIQDQDVFDLRKIVSRLNLEMAIAPEIVQIALKIKPEFVCLVPEKRNELTTEGGLNVLAQVTELENVINQLHKKQITVSIFINTDLEQIAKAAQIGADYIEIHTGNYANALTKAQQTRELNKIITAVKQAQNLGLKINAGHGLKYNNVLPIAKIPGIEELNIGHSIISRAVFVGLYQATKEMLELLNGTVAKWQQARRASTNERSL